MILYPLILKTQNGSNYIRCPPHELFFQVFAIDHVPGTRARHTYSDITSTEVRLIIPEKHEVQNVMGHKIRLF